MYPNSFRILFAVIQICQSQKTALVWLKSGVKSRINKSPWEADYQTFDLSNQSFPEYRLSSQVPQRFWSIGVPFAGTFWPVFFHDCRLNRVDYWTADCLFMTVLLTDKRPITKSFPLVSSYIKLSSFMGAFMGLSDSFQTEYTVHKIIYRLSVNVF